MSGLPQGGFGGRERTGGRRALIAGAIALVLLLAWSYAVLSYGGAEADASKDPAGPEGGQTTGQPSSPEGAPSGSQAIPEEPAYATTPEEPPPAGAPAPHDHPEGAANEPGSYDPLGTGASAGDLAPIDRERLRFAAARFVSAAYGYSGRDEDAYNQGVGETVVWPVFYESPGAAEIERYAAQVEETGTKSAALLTRFDVQKTTPDTAAGYAYFETGAGYGGGGELTGERLAYRQQMTLQRSGAAWKVKATGKIEEM